MKCVALARDERDETYRTRSLEEGLARLKGGRQANLEALSGLTQDQRSRAGTQEGVGRVALCALPHLIAEHDRAHRAEIEALRAGAMRA